MSNAVFPAAIRGLTFSVTKGFEFGTIVQTSPNLATVRIPQTRNPIWHWTLLYEFLKDNPADLAPTLNYTDLQTMMGFLLARSGQADDFLFTDPDDNYVGPAMLTTSPPVVNTQAQLQVVSDGAGNYYSPVQRKMGGLFYEDITDLNGSINLYANGVLQNDVGSGTAGAYTLGGPGLGIPGYSFMGLYLKWAAAAGVWQANHSYALNATILDPSGHVQKVTSAGVSGAFAPSWNDSGGSTTGDGMIVWQDKGTPSWAAAHAYVSNDIILDPSGHIQQVTTAGTSGGSAPTWNDTGGLTTDGNPPLAAAPSVQPWRFVSGVATQEPTGSSTYSYVVLAKNGSTLVSVTSAGSTSQSSAVLSGSGAFNAINWVAVGGATSYDIYRTAGPSAGTGKIASGVTTIFFNDTGQTGDGTSPPANAVVWADRGIPSSWAATHAYSTSNVVMDPSGHVQEATTAGTSGGSAPTWNDTGGTTPDGGIVWADQGAAPGPAAPVTAQFHYYFRVRSESDRQDFDKFSNMLWAAGGDFASGSAGIKLVSSRTPSI